MRFSGHRTGFLRGRGVASHESQLAEVRNLLTEDFAESHVHRQGRDFALTQADQANTDALAPQVDELDVGGRPPGGRGGYD